MSMNIEMNDMYIEDLGDVFSQLDNEDAIIPEETAAVDAANSEDNDLFDLGIDESHFDFEDIEEDGEEPATEEADEEDYEESEEDEEYEEVEEGAAEVTDEDGEEVDFEEYDVTLPDGSMVKLNEAIAGYRSAAELAEERAAFEQERAAFNSQSQDIKSLLELAKLEAQRVVDDYADFDFVGLAKEDPQAYVENREFLDRYKARLKEINSEMVHIKEAEEAEKVAESQRQAAAANAVLAKEIPGWNKELYTELMRYGHSIGMTEEFVTTCTDAGIFKALYKAKQLDQGKQVVKAKIKKIGTPKKVVKPTAKATKPVTNGKKAVLKKRIESGNFDQQDLGNMFDMLED